jgi:hypothetical protein
MVSNFRSLFRNKYLGSTVSRSLNVLTRRERFLMLAVAVIQVFLSLLDLAGVLIVGLLGSLAITGVANSNRGDRVTQALEFLNIEDLQMGIYFLVSPTQSFETITFIRE